MRTIQTLTVLSLALAFSTLAGCGDGGTGGVGLGGGGAAGHYVLDKTAMLATMEQMMKEKGGQMPPEALEMQKSMAKQMVDSMKVEVTLAADKTWEASFEMSVMGQDKKSAAKGTWTQSGNEIRLKTTMEDGKPAAKDDEQVVELKGDTLTMDKGGMKAVLKRR